ncbi:MAG TPA: hypothetical protein VEI96_04280 [Thermodesulfovibrionales bacterium]|nr:hypothetical protein [Thermodesulfovibrionales bacterium]
MNRCDYFRSNGISKLFLALTVLTMLLSPSFAKADQCASVNIDSATLNIPCLSFGDSRYWLDLALPGNVYVVAVDGLSFANTLSSGSAQADDLYLFSALTSSPMDLGQGDGITILPYQWSGDANKTSETVADLRVMLRQSYERALSENGRFVVISHSWGTVLTYLALALESKGPSPIVADLDITLSSPIGTVNVPVLPTTMPFYPLNSNNVYAYITTFTNFWLSTELTAGGCDGCMPDARGAVNYWALGDFISGPLNSYLPVAENINIQNTPLTVRSDAEVASTPYWHEYTSLNCGEYCKPDDNIPLKDQIKDSILKMKNGFILKTYGISQAVDDGMCAAYDAQTSAINVPCVSFNNAKYWVRLGLIFSSPITFDLVDFGEAGSEPMQGESSRDKAGVMAIRDSQR